MVRRKFSVRYFLLREGISGGGAMILTAKNKKHAEFIIKYCIDSGMEPLAANGPLWNHLVLIIRVVGGYSCVSFKSS